MPNPAQSYQGMLGLQHSQGQNMVSGQHSNMGNQMHGMMAQYPSMPSYQVWIQLWGGCVLGPLTLCKDHSSWLSSWKYYLTAFFTMISAVMSTDTLHIHTMFNERVCVCSCVFVCVYRQVSMSQGSQGVPQQTYQQPILLPGQPSQVPMPASMPDSRPASMSGYMPGTMSGSGVQVYYSVITPNQHNTMR